MLIDLVVFLSDPPIKCLVSAVNDGIYDVNGFFRRQVLTTDEQP